MWSYLSQLHIDTSSTVDGLYTVPMSLSNFLLEAVLDLGRCFVPVNCAVILDGIFNYMACDTGVTRLSLACERHPTCHFSVSFTL